MWPEVTLRFERKLAQPDEYAHSSLGSRMNTHIHPKARTIIETGPVAGVSIDAYVTPVRCGDRHRGLIGPEQGQQCQLAKDHRRISS
jgi:hypothetical protein